LGRTEREGEKLQIINVINNNDEDNDRENYNNLAARSYIKL